MAGTLANAPSDAATLGSLGADSLLPDPPPLNNLSIERDAFVGRSRDLEALDHHLSDEGGRSPLVSVLGVGGSEKTQLVLHFSHLNLSAYPGGVWFCDLSEARSADGICFAVARDLDVPLHKGDPVAQLGHAIAGRGRCLVVLDNFKQVARHAEQTLGRWPDRANEAQFIVTSREVLGLRGEVPLPLPPLNVRKAIDLFIARAAAAKRAFKPMSQG